MPKSNINLSKDFLQACQRGDVVKIEALRAEYNIQDWTIYQHTVSGDTGLHLAAREGCLGAVKYLCDTWNEPNFKEEVTNKDMKRPLHESAQFARSSVLEYLIVKGVNIDPLKRADWTPLMLACTKQGHEANQCVHALLKANANPSVQNKDGWTPLLIACRSGNIEVVRLLLEHSPQSIDTRSKNGRSALHIAAFHGHRDLADLLLSKNSDLLDCRDSSGSTPLLESAKSGDLSTMRHLINLNADVRAVDKVGQNILHIAVQSGNMAITKNILETSLVDVNSEALFGITPLTAARRNKQVEIEAILLEYGASDRQL